MEKNALDELYKEFKKRDAVEKAAEDVETKEAEKDAKITDLENKVSKLEEASVKIAKGLTASGIEVGRPDTYKGFNFKKQGTDAPEYLPSNEKEKDAVIKEVIDVFAKYSTNPKIQKAAMQEGTSGEGSDYVPELWYNSVIEKARLVSIALQDCRRFPMTGNVLHIPSQGSSVSMTYAAEEAASSQSEPGSADVDLTAGRFGLWGTISQELLDDAMIDMVSYITRDAVEECGQTIDDEVFNGTSAPFTAALGCGTTDVIFGASNTANSYEDMVSRNYFDAIYSLTGVRRRGAKWYLDKALMPYIMNLKYGASDSALMSLNPSAIAGYSFAEIEALSGTDATSSDFILFGNLQNYALGIRSESKSIEVNPYAGTEFKAHQVLFRFAVRMAGAPIFTDHFVNVKTA